MFVFYFPGYERKVLISRSSGGVETLLKCLQVRLLVQYCMCLCGERLLSRFIHI